jgi:hypothetical protein
MNIKLLSEHGYDEASLGFSLSYNTSIERAKFLLPKYAFGQAPGENKFLRMIWLWFDVDFPRLIWPEIDQYKVATTTLSESTIHTLNKRHLTQEDFIVEIDYDMLMIINDKIDEYNKKEIDILNLKSHLPEGFLQRRIWNMNYATLQNIFNQRKTHKIKLWNKFIDIALSSVEHPEFIVKSV